MMKSGGRLIPLAAAFLGCLLCCSAAGSPDAGGSSPLNVLLICVDDLRTELGCYGASHIRTPALDRLASEGRRFNGHYVHSAVCGPSRSTLLGGKRTLHWSYLTPLRNQLKKNPDLPEPSAPVSLPHHFRRNGYRTVCIGKVSHQPGGVVDDAQTVHELPFSWDRAFAPVGGWKTPWRAFFSYAGGESYNAIIQQVKGEPPRLPYEEADVPDTGYADGLNAEAAVEQLGKLSREDRPFLLAVGFYKPHLPFNAPKRYWDLYPEDTLPMAPYARVPRDTDARISLHDSYEPTSHYHWPDGRGNVSEEKARILRRGYFACVSYVDAQIGKVLDEYRRLGLQKNTIVVLWSDHGWHLGDHGIWGKFTNHEFAVRSPLIIRVPGMALPGAATDGLIETVDLFPTLSELCGLPVPPGLEGRSLAALVRDPSRPGRPDALSVRETGSHRGATLRTARHRIVEWTDRKTGEMALVELYDLEKDPLETANIAGKEPETARQLLARLHARLAGEE